MTNETPRRFTPAIRLLNCLSYPQKLLLIGALSAVPLVVALTMLIGEISQRIELTKQDMADTANLPPIMRLLDDLQRHRGMTYAFQSGDASFEDRLATLRLRIVPDHQTADATDWPLAPKIGATARWSALEQTWRGLQGRVSSLESRPNFEEQTALIAELLALIAQVGDSSKLIFDRDLVNYYLMDTVVVRLPALIEGIGQARGWVSGTAARGPITPYDAYYLTSLAARSQLQWQAVRQGLALAFRENPELRRELEPALVASQSAGDAFHELLESQLLEAGRIVIEPDGYWTAGSEALDAIFRLWNLTLPALDGVLQARIDSLARRRNAFVLVTLVSGLLVAYLFTRRLRTERAQAREEAARAAAAESSLRKSQSEMHAIVETASDGIVTIDERGVVESFNGAAERIFGYRSEEVIGHNVSMLMPSPERELHTEYIERHLRSGQGTAVGTGREVVGLHKDGRPIPLRLSLSEMRPNGCIAFTAILHDISEHKQLEARLNAERASFHNVVERSADGIIVTDGNGVVKFLNATTRSLFGKASEQMLGSVFGFAATGEDFSEIKIIRSDGGIGVGELRASETSWDEKPASLIAIRDVTERKQAEEELRDSEARLAEQAEELALSNKELGEFAYIASHDLQAPLRAIENLTEWVMEDLGELLEGETRENMELLRRRVDRMKRLLDDLLCYSRAGHVEAKIERVDVGELVTEIATWMDPPAGFQVVADDGLPVFETGRTSLVQVLQNLIENAIKHHDRKQGRVEVSASDRGDHYEFVVADDGPGIPPELHDKALKMFQTLRPRDEVEGSGIGLAVVKKVVERQGGRLRVESKANGRGTVFHFDWRKGPEEAMTKARGQDR